MKKIALTFYLLMFFLISRSQTNTFPSSGNVGIGTITPGANLVVNGKARIISNMTIGADEDPQPFFPLYIKGSPAQIAFNVYNQPVDQRYWAAIGNGNNFRIITENDAFNSIQEGLILTRSGINITSVTFPNGNVGIGTTTPSSKLEVVGKIISSGAAGVSGSLEAHNVQNGNAYFTTNTTSGNGYANLNALDGTIKVSLNSSGISYFNGGNLLIGKTSQTNSSYILDIAGNVRCNKLIVNTTGADYVFDSAYNLLPLNKIENYIKQNHHLPNIPSANEMQLQGIDLGQNQAQLLAKTEELTLYLIEQNKIAEEQANQIKTLQSQINILQKELDSIKQQIEKK